MSKLLSPWGKKFVLACWAMGLAVSLGASTASAVVVNKTYELSNHPDGGARYPLYGFRLDGLDTGNAGRIFTFDLEHASITKPMLLDLTYDLANPAINTVRIHGQAYGGQDVWNSNSPALDPDDYYADNAFTGLWEIDFTYTTNVAVTEVFGVPAAEITSEAPLNNTGTIFQVVDKFGNVDLSKTYSLEDEEGNKGYSFRFDNGDHRLSGTPLFNDPSVFVGRGWMNHSQGPANPNSDNRWVHLAASDWLFVATEQQSPPGGQVPLSPSVPEPVTGLLSLMGLATLGLATRRRAV